VGEATGVEDKGTMEAEKEAAKEETTVPIQIKRIGKR
jgi:hypothetical protein